MIGYWNSLLRNFSKKVVKDHLIDDKVKRMLFEKDKKENSSEPESEAEDFGTYREKIMKKASAVDKVYKKMMDKDESDIKDADYWKMQKAYQKTVSEYFSPENYKIDPLHHHRIDKTKRLVRALRVNNTFDFVREKNVDVITKEYNNYSKFEKNYSFFKENQKNAMLDDGSFHVKGKLSAYMAKLAPLGDYDESINYKVRLSEMAGQPAHSNLYEHGQMEMEDLEGQIQADDSEIIETSDYLHGRLSPHARESIYELYKEGWSVNDLSFKFGILPERTKAVIWMRRYFYDEVAPVLDRTFWRLGLEKEIIYAVKYPFVDYGLDLSLMALLEKGISNIKFGDTPIDINPPQEVVKKVQEKAAEIKPTKVYTIVRGTIGEGPKMYTLKDMVVRRGSGKLNVSTMFQKICFRGEETPHAFPKKVRKNLDKGPRIASYGHRVSHKTKRTVRYYNKDFHSL